MCLQMQGCTLLEIFSMSSAGNGKVKFMHRVIFHFTFVINYSYEMVLDLQKMYFKTLRLVVHDK
jgi:hypothetical protein